MQKPKFCQPAKSLAAFSGGSGGQGKRLIFLKNKLPFSPQLASKPWNHSMEGGVGWGPGISVPIPIQPSFGAQLQSQDRARSPSLVDITFQQNPRLVYLKVSPGKQFVPGVDLERNDSMILDNERTMGSEMDSRELRFWHRIISLLRVKVTALVTTPT